MVENFAHPEARSSVVTNSRSGRGVGTGRIAPVLLGEDPQPPFKPGDPLPHRRGDKNTASSNSPKVRRSALPG